MATKYEIDFDVLFPSPEEMVKAFDDARKDIRYIVTDYPVELFVAKFKEENPQEGDLYIPEYQRSLRWNDQAKSYFIESVLLRIPIPPVFLYESAGRLEVVDGSQRVRTLFQFSKDTFRLDNLQKLDVLSGLFFSELPLIIQRRFLNTSIRAFVLDEGTDTSTRIEMFRRLNTTGKRLHDAEIRKGAFQGPFLDLILECAKSDLFLRLTPRISKASDSESERQELVTRFFVYSDYYRDFRHDVQKFLDEHVVQGNASFSQANLTKMRAEFHHVMSFIELYYPDAFYRTPKAATVPRVRFESIAVGTCLATRAKSSLEITDLSWIRGDDLNALVRTDASNSGPRLRARIDYVRDKLLGAQ